MTKQSNGENNNKKGRGGVGPQGDLVCCLNMKNDVVSTSMYFRPSSHSKANCREDPALCIVVDGCCSVSVFFQKRCFYF